MTSGGKEFEGVSLVPLWHVHREVAVEVTLQSQPLRSGKYGTQAPVAGRVDHDVRQSARQGHLEVAKRVARPLRVVLTAAVAGDRNLQIGLTRGRSAMQREARAKQRGSIASLSAQPGRPRRCGAAGE